MTNDQRDAVAAAMKKSLQNSFHDKSIIPLLIYNSVPLLGVIFLRWDPAGLILLYIAETVIIGIVNILKIFLAQVPVENNQKPGIFGKLFIALFFMVHYNFFVIGQTVIISSSVGVNISDDGFLPMVLINLLAYLVTSPWWVGVVAAVIIHFYYFLFEYVGKAEYTKDSPVTVMFSPYPRIIVQQFVGIFGGMLVALSGFPILMLILLQVLKTIAEVVGHVFQRDGLKSFQKKAQA